MMILRNPGKLLTSRAGLGAGVQMAENEKPGSSEADNAASDELASKHKLLSNVSLLSDLPTTHEDLMFSSLVDDIEKNPPGHALSPQFFIAKEDTEGDVTGGGPIVRNMIIMKMLRKCLTDKFKGPDKEKKSVMNILELIWNELAKAINNEVDGIAIFHLRFTRLSKGMAHGLIIFHRGSTLLLETLDKNKVRHTWENPVDKTDMLNIRNLTQVQDIVQVSLKKLESIVGRDLPSSRRNTIAFPFPQDSDAFSHYGDENHSGYCWLCGVTVRKLKKATCAGCLVARYCTLGCQEEDWSRHRNYCMKKKASREEEKTVLNMKKAVFIDWDQEVD